MRVLVLLAALGASPLLAHDLVPGWLLRPDARCEAAPVGVQPPSADCVRGAVALVRQRAINALAQGIVVQDPSLTRQWAVDRLNAPLVVYFRQSFIFVYEAWDGGSNGGSGGVVTNVCAAGVTWTNDRIEVSLADDTNNRIFRLVMWEAANAMVGRAGLTYPDGSGGWGDGPIVQMLADARGVSCSSVTANAVPEPTPLAVTR